MTDINLGVGAANSATGGYEIANSLKLEQDNTEYLHKTPTSSGNRKTFTLSAWIKRTEVNRGSGGGDYIFQAGDGDYNQSDRTLLKFNHDDTIYWGGGSAYEIKTNRVFRDTSAWYHIVMIVDTTSGTAGDRLKLYVNGVRETSFSSSSNPSQNFDYAFMKDDKHTIGYNHTDSSNPASMYITEVVWLDGTAANITDLGEFDDDSGIWKPKDVSSLSVGTNGCYLDFEDSSTLGNDVSGGTDFTLNNISSADQATDTPTNNFCTMNPLWAASYITYTEGATNVDTTGSGWMSMASTFAVNKGKWYWEFKRDSGNAFVGITDAEDKFVPRSTAGYFYGYNDNAGTNSLGMYSVNGQVYNSPGGTPDGTTYTTSQIVGVAVDMDNYKLYYHVDGTYAGSMDPAAGSGGVTIPTTWDSGYVYMGFSGFNGSYAVNFGGYTTISISSAANDGKYGNFEYAPPSGYYALCSKRLVEYG